MSAIKVADLFAAVGMRFNPKELNNLQKRLDHVKRQFMSLNRVAQLSLAQAGNVTAIRSLNAELTRTALLVRQIQAAGPIRVAGGRGAGAAAAGRGGITGPRGSRFGGGSGAHGLAAGLGMGRAGFFGRNFFAGFTGAIAIRSLFQAQVGLDAIKVGIEAILKPGETLVETMGFLRSESERLGFEFSTSAIEFSKLAAAGNAAGLSTAQIREIFISAQEAARVFSLSVADTEGVLKAFQQIISKGKVTAEELRNQLGDRLPAAVPLAAKALGVTTEELNQMLEKGEVIANDFLPKFARTLRESFAGSVEDASKTAQSELNRFLNAWFDFRNAIIGGGLGDTFRLILTAAGEILKVLTPIVRTVARGFRMLATPIHAVFRILDALEKAIPGVNSKLLGLAATIGTLIFILRKFTLAQIAAFAPWILGAAALSAIVILIDDLATALRGGESAIAIAAESSNTFVATLAQMLLLFGGLVQFLAEFVAFLVMGGDGFDMIAEKARAFRDIIFETVAKLGEFADMLSFGALGKLGSFLGQGAADATDFFKGAADFLPDFAGFGRGGNQTSMTGSPITVHAPGGDANAIASKVEEVVRRENEAMLRQAQSSFGDIE